MALRQRAFRAARRHSRLVKALRVLLPTSATATLAAFMVSANASMPAGLDVSIGRMNMSSSGIVMEQPRISGFDEAKREYRIVAARATQKFLSPDEVRLETIDAAVITPDHGRITITAGTGDYDHKARTLVLAGGVKVGSEDGYSMDLSEVSVDLGKMTLRSDGPVRIGYKGGDTVGDRLDATEGGKLVVLDGRVKTVITPSRLASAKRPKDARTAMAAPDKSLLPKPASLVMGGGE